MEHTAVPCARGVAFGGVSISVAGQQPKVEVNCSWIIREHGVSAPAAARGRRTRLSCAGLGTGWADWLDFWFR
jgi:hypothetical protein